MFNCFAAVARGLEELMTKELEQLGAEGVEPEFCGVGFGAIAPTSKSSK